MLNDKKIDKISAKEKISKMFATARIYCLISVVSAHSYFPETSAWEFLTRLGTVGVILFLITSGYYFTSEKFSSFGDLVCKKAVTIGIPWLFLGSLAWLYNAIVSTQFRSPLGYLNWIFGKGTYLYYMPILVICFLLFYKAPTAVVITALPITIISILLTASGVMDSVVSSIGINHYLNILNWCGFFALGLLLRKINPEKLFAFFRKYWFINVALFAFTFSMLLTFKEIRYDYFSFIAIPYELLGCLAILSLSTFDLTKFKALKYLSSYSFGIYLSHMVVLGLIDSVLSKTVITMYFAPFVIIGIALLSFISAEFVSRLLKIKNIYFILVGRRDK